VRLLRAWRRRQGYLSARWAIAVAMRRVRARVKCGHVSGEGLSRTDSRERRETLPRSRKGGVTDWSSGSLFYMSARPGPVRDGADRCVVGSRRRTRCSSTCHGRCPESRQAGRAWADGIDAKAALDGNGQRSGQPRPRTHGWKPRLALPQAARSRRALWAGSPRAGEAGAGPLNGPRRRELTRRRGPR
jgi:hypothetical protein